MFTRELRTTDLIVPTPRQKFEPIERATFFEGNTRLNLCGRGRVEKAQLDWTIEDIDRAIAFLDFLRMELTRRPA